LAIAAMEGRKQKRCLKRHGYGFMQRCEGKAQVELKVSHRRKAAGGADADGM
jgi:hypothetical protein